MLVRIHRPPARLPTCPPNFHRDDLIPEDALCNGFRRPLLALVRKGVLLLTCDPVLPRDLLGGLTE
jgi:hypothetical protein